MGKRKVKNNVKQEDQVPLVLDPPVVKSKPRNHYVLLCFLLFVVVVGGPLLSWLCYQQQQSIDDLAETVTSLQRKFVKFQQHDGAGNTQVSLFYSLFSAIIYRVQKSKYVPWHLFFFE